MKIYCITHKPNDNIEKLGLIPVGGTSANDMDGFPALLLKTFLIALTPVATLPALMTYGPGKK